MRQTELPTAYEQLLYNPLTMKQTSPVLRVAAAAMLLLLIAPWAPAQVERRVRFARGRTSAVLKGKIVNGEGVVYVLGAGRGQTLIANVSTTSPNHDVVFSIEGPDGAGLMEDVDTGFTGTLPKTGDYRISVGAIESQNASFTLEVTIR